MCLTNKWSNPLILALPEENRSGVLSLSDAEAHATHSNLVVAAEN